MSNTPPPPKTNKGLITLGKFFRRKVQAWQGTPSNPTISPATTYQEFSVSGLDYSGQISSGYGRTGGGLDVTVTPDFGDVLLPGLATASLSVTAGFQYQKQALVVLQRLPKNVYNGRVSTIPLPKVPPDPSAPILPKPIWSTPTPVTLQMLGGYYGTVKLSATATVGVETGLPVGTDELGIALSASLTASGTLGIECVSVKLADDLPAFFPSPSDSSMQLDAAVKALIGCTSKDEAKIEIENFLKDKMKEWFTTAGQAITQPPPPPPPQPPDGLDKTDPGPDPKDEATQILKSTLISRFEGGLNRGLAMIGATAKVGGLVDILIAAWNKPKTNDLLVRLQSLKIQLGLLVDQTTDSTIKANLITDGQQINVYIDLLLFFQKVQTPPQNLDYRNKLCMFNALSFSGNYTLDVTADAKFTASPNLELPDGADGLTLCAQADAVANANSKGVAQLVSYRYQSYGEGDGQPLVITQDTFLTYRNANVAASVAAGLSAELGDFKSVELALGERAVGAYYRSMTYQSAVTAWTHPLSTALLEAPIAPLSRSGLVYGCSVSLGRLAKAVDAIEYSTADAPRALTYVRNLARQLRLDQTVLKQFLSDAGLGELAFFTELGKLAAQGLPDIVYLESSFAFDATVKLKAKRKGTGTATDPFYYRLSDPFSDPTVRAFITTLKAVGSPPLPNAPPPTPPLALEAIRIRFRIADCESTSESLLSLGFGDGLVSIDLSSVQGAGHEGFFDYYVQWYNNPDFNFKPDDTTSLPGDFKMPYERCVPPVALLHQ